MRLWGWERRKDDLSEELEAHLRMAVEDRVGRGASPEEARAEAMREMGNAPLVADVTREQWGWGWLERMGQDVRYAMRQLRKSPGYTVTALLTLTLAVGANTAIFGLFYALLLRSLPVDRPDQIVQVKLQLGTGGVKGEPSPLVSDGMYDLLSKTQTSFTGLCGWQEDTLNLHEGDGTQPTPAAALTGECMRVLGLHAAAGRLLQDADDKAGGAAEGYPVVLGYDYWRTHFGADPGVLGRVMEFGASFRAGAAKGVVVGVMAPGFESVQVGGRPNFYVPLAMTDPHSTHNLSSFNMSLIARLRDGVSAQAAEAQVDAVFQAKLKEEKNLRFFTFVGGRFAEADQVHALATPGRTGYSYLRQEYEKPLYLIEGMVGLSLLVACAYLAMLASGRALARRRELALRMALGASRWSVAAQLTWESVLLAVAGGGLGTLFAWIAERGLVALMRPSWSENLELHAGPGGAVLLFTLALMGLTVMLAGVWPAWRASKVDPASDIKEGEASIAGGRRPRMGTLLVPLQIAFSLVMVTIAALMGTTVTRLLAVDPGFRTSGVTILSADFSPRRSNFSDGVHHGPPPAALFIALLDKVQHTPGVESASISLAYPLGGGTYMENVSSQPSTGGTRTDNNLTQLAVTPGYLDTMGVPMLAGRDFTLDDRGEKLTVCILNRSAADYFFPGGDALGGTVTMGRDATMRVVGIVGDTLYNDLRQKAPRMIYQPYLEYGISNPFAHFEVRARDAGTAVSAVRNAFRELAPDVAVDKPVTMQELVSNSMGRERMVALLAGFFALLTLALTGIGLYGVLNYGVVRRRTEIGVRMALGATPSGVVTMILREAMRLVLPGVALGAAGVWGATRLLNVMLYGVTALNPWACAGSAAVLLVSALMASVLPARRAAKVDPIKALRFE
ncbi:ABC transporter permease [Occallatibacter riparius]|uniref:ABC transporter permease n=1 Tax=Occallatibacter riparius TaxID=1002689 RepID=A0A9J7BVJ9_9BACT|nr:ABC transporter permease [Occallatibacter riparius]UWZ85037.1 ABC transporter permease [Occallatibacter riparius]